MWFVKLIMLRSRDDDRTLRTKTRNCPSSKIPSYAEGCKLGWNIPIRDILLHIVGCETECLQLHSILIHFFAMHQEYQVEAA